MQDTSLKQTIIILGITIVTGALISIKLDYILSWLIAVNIMAFIVFWLDKKRAEKAKTRISESSLLVLTLFGGTIGSIIAMLLFRHKTRKLSFLILFWPILIVQAAAALLFVFRNNINP